jgi:carbamoyltransferase
VTVVIGFTFHPWHDNSAAVIVDGKLVFATEEERFTRHKHSVDEAPVNSLIKAFQYLERFNIKPGDVDAFATNWRPNLFPIRERFHILTYSLNTIAPFSALNRARKDFAKWTVHGYDFTDITRLLLEKVYKQIGAEFPAHAKIVPVEHHLAHAASAYYFSGFPSATVLTVDGRGERDATAIWKVKQGEFEKISSVLVEEGSIGILYEMVSERIKFNRLEGPGKVMGLAPYGKYDEQIATRFKQILKTGCKDAPYIFADRFRAKAHPWSYVDLERLCSSIADFIADDLPLDWNPKQEPTPPAANLAWHVQDFTENLMQVTAKWAKDQTGESRIALAGGVALNAKVNMKLHYSKMFEEMFIFPAASDQGGSIGAAAYVYEHVLGEKMKNGALDNVYLGPEYDDEQVKDVVRKGKWKAEFIGTDVSSVSELVSKGQIIVWYQGRAELGPRALGNRSIVADPTREDTWRTMNKIKGREYWRPLAPSVLSEDKETYFKNPVDHGYMILMFQMTEEGAKRAPAICHVDNTSRPQTVSRQINPLWYDLISGFKSIKGEGLVVNTSFNLAGEPLVETPQDAIRSFAIGGFDAIYLQGWLLRK